jgi:hypothetical protein
MVVRTGGQQKIINRPVSKLSTGQWPVPNLEVKKFECSVFLVNTVRTKVKRQMLPNLPTKWVYGQKLPFGESNVAEFKEVTVFSGLFRDKSLGKTGLTKYRETIMAFLNSGMGYLFMGIKDDSTIVGVENVTPDKIDALKLWIDSHFNALVYTDGKPLDPTKVSIKLNVYDMENSLRKIIVIEARNTGKLFDIMTYSGTIVHRLNASNFRIVAEPIYRKRDVKGMIYAMRGQIERIISERKRAISDLKERHREEMERAVLAERASIREYIDKISKSLYERYKFESDLGGYLSTNTIISVAKYILCLR